VQTVLFKDPVHTAQ